MNKVIKLSISGSGIETDAPSVEDLLDQVKDYLEILKSVEQTVTEDGDSAIDWRVVNASKNSPLSIEFAAFSRKHAVNIDERATKVVQQTAFGLSMLQNKSERPSYFNDKTVARAEKLFQRVTNGLSTTQIDHGPGLPRIEVNRGNARAAVAHAAAVLKPPAKPYKELGSVEGFALGVGRDGWGHKLLFVRHRLTGEEFRCRINGEALTQVQSKQIGDVWRACRVQVFGMIHYKSPGHITQVDAVSVRFLRERSELPSIDDVQDENFTGGMRSEDYLAKVRDGELS
jgi:D-Tyr-tRNAtyr deacylase